MPFLTASGTRLYYEEYGVPGGRPALLLHASLQTSDSMDPLRDLLVPLALRLIIPDQRGHGRSGNPTRSLSIPMLADDITSLMHQLGLERPIVAGYSLGGIVGIELARRGLVSGAVVLAARTQTASRGRAAFDPENLRQRSPLWAQQLAEKHVEIPWEELALELGLMLETWPGFAREELAAITCPMLVVQGDRDLMVPLGQAEELAATVPGARLYVAPRAGHPELLYRPDAMKAVSEFLAALPA